MEPEEESVPASIEDGELIGNPIRLNPRNRPEIRQVGRRWPGQVLVIACARGGGGDGLGPVGPGPAMCRGPRHRPRRRDGGRAARGACTSSRSAARSSSTAESSTRTAGRWPGQPAGWPAAPGIPDTLEVLPRVRRPGDAVRRGQARAGGRRVPSCAARAPRGMVDRPPAFRCPTCDGGQVENRPRQRIEVETIRGGGRPHTSTKVTVVEEALDANNTIATPIGADFDRAGVSVVNLMSAPGAGAR